MTPLSAIFFGYKKTTFSYYSNVSVLIGTVLYVEFMFQNMRRNINLELVLELTWLEWHFRYIISDYVNKFYVTRRYIQSFRSCDLFFDQWNFVLLFFWRHVTNKWQNSILERAEKWIWFRLITRWQLVYKNGDNHRTVTNGNFLPSTNQITEIDCSLFVLTTLPVWSKAILIGRLRGRLATDNRLITCRDLKSFLCGQLIIT